MYNLSIYHRNYGYIDKNYEINILVRKIKIYKNNNLFT